MYLGYGLFDKNHLPLWPGVGGTTFRQASNLSGCLHFLTTLNTILLLEEVFFTCQLTHKSSECFKYPLGGSITITLTPAAKKNFLLKSSHSKTYILGKLIFLASKNLEMENFNPKTSYDHSYHFKSLVTPGLHKRSCEMYLLTAGIKMKRLSGQNID